MMSLGELAFGLVGSYLLYLAILGLRDQFRYLRWKYSRNTFHF